MNAKSISFGDTVRIRRTDVTEDACVADLLGTVYGWTTPSITGIDVIGDFADDYAINVHFEAKGRSLWFAPDLLDFVDHAPGTEITLDGMTTRLVRNADGKWVEHSIGRLPEKKRP